MKPPATLQQAILYFSDPVRCREYLIALRWPDGVACPRCGSKNVLFMDEYNRWHCREKHKAPQFTLKTGTAFEDSPLGLDKWLVAFWMAVNCKNGVSSHELHRAIGVTRKSAWFMLHRIRDVMRSKSATTTMGSPDGGEVEADETYVGPIPGRMHKSRRVKIEQQRAAFTNAARDRPRFTAKTAVRGILDRENRRVNARVVVGAKRETLQTAILDNVVKGSRLYTDERPAYCSFEDRTFTKS